MLDHVFIDAIGALRDALEAALLERLTPDESFQVDVLLGDASWETTYVLPGESSPPRVRADITLSWPTWSQTAFRAWVRNEPMDEDPRIDITVVLRVQRLGTVPEPSVLTAVLPVVSARLGRNELRRTPPTIETAYTAELVAESHAVELAYHGTYDLDDAALTDGATLDTHFAEIGSWIASMLVRLGDLALPYLDTRD